MGGDVNDNRVTDFVRLLASHEHSLSSYVLALVPNWTDAEEIIQQTKVRLWEQFSNYDPAKDFGVWACVIARYEVLTFRKRLSRSRIQCSQEFLDRVSEEMIRTDEQTDSRKAFLDECVKKLTVWHRDLLLRCCVAGDSVAKVAAEMGRSAESTRKALLRIRRKLFHCVEAAERREGE